MDSYDELIFGLGFTNNKESNDYLRCLWSCIRNEFGKIAWNLFPTKIGDRNLIIVGRADIGQGEFESIGFEFTYGKRGCLKSVKITSIKDQASYERIALCLKNAKDYKNKYIKKYLAIELEANIEFAPIHTNQFHLEGNKLYLCLNCFDSDDAKWLYLTLLQTICSILSFYTLIPIVLSHSSLGINYGRKLKIEVPKPAAEHISELLERDFNYENNETPLEQAMYAFMQGLIMERLTMQSTMKDITYTENAILNYMSSLEIITLHDSEPIRCETCGQMRYAIARRVKDLAAKSEPKYAEQISAWISNFYQKRSSFVHTGKRLSSNNYIGLSTPLLSLYDSDGIINQVSIIDDNLKREVRNMILFHEGLPKIIEE